MRINKSFDFHMLTRTLVLLFILKAITSSAVTDIDSDSSHSQNLTLRLEKIVRDHEDHSLDQISQEQVHSALEAGRNPSQNLGFFFDSSPK